MEKSAHFQEQELDYTEKHHHKNINFLLYICAKLVGYGKEICDNVTPEGRKTIKLLKIRLL